MGDFLSNIVAQSLSLRQVVRPRPLSRFEPVQSTGDVTWAQPFEDGSGDTQAAPVQTEGLRTEAAISPVQGEAGQRRAPQLEVSPRRDVTGPSQLLSPAPDRHITPEIAAPPDEAAAPGHHMVVPESTSRVSGRRDRLEIGKKGATALTEGRPRPQDSPSSLFPPDLTEDLPGQSPGSEPTFSLEIKPRIERLVKELRPLAEVSPEKAVQAGPRPRQDPHFGAKEQLSGSPSSAPTIQVTIGRIEVKATPAAEAPRRRPTAPKSVSLDEYLRQRNERGRR
jgi:hypothetical protein